ncbi:glycoside hydrolase family 127 protein [Burkholderia glumae]|uniref:glycoside hydrolase family 127 protein n=1 Tax=Burkholderia glumae TaxID=337 RepID=UPI000F5D9F05|nr:beta-L-arabinofuranosidase domain-containing protein [Burkholderia glumae]MCM2550811.1 glycoside hydrolase family 127 protein [Burkholderia glumae]MCQ0030091.1 glycoside hydrolase family 127 protein [Burkholderia glumae]MCQ0039058.1 glycoside hydrolase family 127 protein [Burkholderia glumae]QGA40253.1 glycoside hydrolase family 127 protein [Burkholderia glumae]RQZ72138.1 glycoside hydrolase family 127 protein [Burkholderia glumae]
MNQLNHAASRQVSIEDTFWRAYRHLVRGVVVPYQWEALNDRIADTEPSGAVRNFRIAAGEGEGAFTGMVFQDSDITKWLEAVAYLLAEQRDAELEQIADETIDLLARAQHDDGYLNTYFTIKAPGQRWTNLAECHELYCAGHLIEAAVAYWQATGKRKLLEVAERFVAHIDTVFGTEAGKLNGYPGHPEIELALMRLHEVSGNPRHLALARYFVEQRGARPHYYDIEYEKRGRVSHWDVHGRAWITTHKAYSQAHKPIAEQDAAVGHAVRLVYLYAGVAHLARVSGDAAKLNVCKAVWRNMVTRQMYVTGGIGAQVWGESFTCDYELPNDTAYTETCASVGLVFFARRMLEASRESGYADVLERALYNTVLAGIGLDGRSFFYVNPLETHPAGIRGNHKYEHVKPVRQRWFGCACCPPNVARLIASLDQYVYLVDDSIIYVNLYVAGEARLNAGTSRVTLRQQGNYPWRGDLRIVVEQADGFDGTIAVRLPDWCAAPEVRVNGDTVACSAAVDGYLHLPRVWHDGDTIELVLPMTVRRLTGHGKLRHAAGKVAVQRGPIVYCIEQADNGADLHALYLPRDAGFEVVDGAQIDASLAEKVVLQARGYRISHHESDDALYEFDAEAGDRVPQTLTFIPYFCWANRGEGEMRVWVNSD